MLKPVSTITRAPDFEGTTTAPLSNLCEICIGPSGGLAAVAAVEAFSRLPGYGNAVLLGCPVRFAEKF